MVGFFCKDLNSQSLFDFFSESGERKIKLTNAIFLEIKSHCFSVGFSWEEFYQLFNLLMPEDTSLRCFQTALDAMFRTKQKLQKSHKKSAEGREKYLSFCSKTFSFPKPSLKQGKEKCPSVCVVKENDIQPVLNQIAELENQMLVMMECLKEESIEKIKYKKQVRSLEDERKKLSSDLKKALFKVGRFTPRNVGKRERKKELEISELKEEVDDKDSEISSLEKEIEDLNKQLSSALLHNNRARKRIYDLKQKIEKGIPENSSESENCFRSRIRDLNAEIAYLQNEKLELQSQIDTFIENNVINVFENGVYNDNVRMVYEVLMCLGIGSRNVEKAIRIVLKKLANLEVGRLPKATFAKYMLLETRALAHIQLLSELTGNSDDGKISDQNTLMSDGTCKKGHSYGTYDIQTNSGKCLVAGVRPTANGEAETQLHVLKEIFEDISSFGPKKGEDFSARLFASIKNLMSDRCVTQKRFNRLFIEYRNNLIPQIVENWDSLSEDERKEFKKVNEFFCGLHYIVGLADQADECLKIHEGMLYKENKVGSLATKNGFPGGESGTTRLIRTVCKAVSDRGCEKSGRMVTFATFLEGNHELVNKHLYPFWETDSTFSF